MLKNISQYEIAIENRLYRLICEMDSPLEHVKEFLFQASTFVGNIQSKVKEMEAQKVSQTPQQPKEASDGQFPH